MISGEHVRSYPVSSIRRLFRRERSTSVAIAGAGLMAVLHAVTAQQAGMKVTAVASRGGTNARHLAGQFDARRVSVDALPAGADVLVVATPPDTHEKYVLQGISAGASVLVEKPLTTTLASADRMVAAVEGPGAPRVIVAENLLSSPYWRAALAHRSSTGSLSHLSAVVVQPPPDWGHFLEPLTAGGVLFDLGPHPISLVLGTAMEDVVAVSAELSSRRADGADDQASVQIRFTSGLVATIELSWNSPDTQWSVQAASDDMVVRLEFSPETLVELNGEPVTVAISGAGADPRLETMGYLDQLLSIDPIATVPEPGSGQSVRQARDVLEVICAAYASAGRNGAEVPLPFDGARDLTPMQLWHQADGA